MCGVVCDDDGFVVCDGWCFGMNDLFVVVGVMNVYDGDVCVCVNVLNGLNDVVDVEFGM